MKTLKKIVLFIFIGTLFVTCKKEQLAPTTVEGQPVFSFTGNIASNTVTMQAGVNNYYMYSTYSQNSAGVYSFNGTLQSTSSPNNSIQILINDYKVMPQNASLSLAHIDSALSTTLLYAYNKGIVGNDTLYSVTFTPKVYYGTPTTYLYSFGDHTNNLVTTNDSSVTHLYPSKNHYNTSLDIDFSGGCGNIYISNPLNIIKNTPSFIIDSIHSATGSLDSIIFNTAVSNGVGPYTYKFYFGDGDSSVSTLSNSIFSCTHKYLSVSTFPVKLKVNDANNDTASYNYSVSDDTLLSCRFDYTMSAPTLHITPSNPDFLSDITIIYTNSAGVQYTSKDASQLGTFQILSVSAYQNNANNNPTMMLKVTFNCSLYNSTATPSAISANNCTAIIAVAYKQ